MSCRAAIALTLAIVASASAQAYDLSIVHQVEFNATAPGPHLVFTRIGGSRCNAVLTASAYIKQARVVLQLAQLRCPVGVGQPDLAVGQAAMSTLVCSVPDLRGCQSGFLEAGSTVRF